MGQSLMNWLRGRILDAYLFSKLHDQLSAEQQELPLPDSLLKVVEVLKIIYMELFCASFRLFTVAWHQAVLKDKVTVMEFTQTYKKFADDLERKLIRLESPLE